MDLFLALYSLGGLLLAGLSVPMILQKVPPSWSFGLRATDAPNGLRRWYKMNAYAGHRFLVVGLATSVGCIILYFLLSPDVVEYAMSCLGLFLALFLWSIISSFLYFRSLQNEV